MTSTNHEKAPRKKAYFFPALVVGLLVMQVGLCFIGVYYATHSNANVVENDYYDKALHWDQQVAAEQASAALGWKTAIRVSERPDLQGNRTFVMDVKDRSGAAVTGARIRMIFFHHAQARLVETVELQEQDSGSYVATIATARAGIWEFRLVAERGKEKFVKREAISLNDGR